MLRIVDGIVFEGKPSADRWSVSFFDLGHGQREVVASRCLDWVELHRLDPDSIAGQLASGLRDLTPEEVRDRELANARRAARRAKSQLRRRVKSMGCSRLLTLTYQANQTDEALCKAHLKEFVRRVRRLIPDFAYVAAFETQKRGAYHVHMAIHALPRLLPAVNGVKVKSYGVIRAIWRAVIGGGGNIDDSDGRRRARGLPRMSTARIAAYISKYLAKAFEAGADYSKRFTSSKHSMPPAERVELRAASMREVFDLCWSFGPSDGDESFAWVSEFGDALYIASGSPPESG